MNRWSRKVAPPQPAVERLAQDLLVGDRDIDVVRRSCYRLLAEHRAVQYLEHIQTGASRGAVGAEADANATAHHFQNTRGTHAVIIERAMARRDIALRVEVYLVVAEQN